MRGYIQAWLTWSAVYVFVSIVVAILAHGTDLDQLTSRSAMSRAAAALDRVLWAPYRAFGRAVRPDPDQMPLFTPMVLMLNALAWGAAFAAGARLAVRALTSTDVPRK